MKLPNIEYRQAESLGRNNISAVGGVASAISAKSSAENAVLQNMARVGGEFIRREETSIFKTALTNTQNSESQYIEDEGVKEFFTGEELEGRVKGVELYSIGADKNGKEIKTYKKNIPAYKVWPQLLNQKLTGDMEVYGKTITNPLDRKAFLENRSVDIGNKVRKATLESAREQFNVVREESDMRRDEALSNGNIRAANLEAEQFDGSDFEKQERLTENKQQMEIWTGDRLIQIEDEPGIRKMLDYLTDEKYKEKGGPLPERPNIDLQNRLRGKLQSLQIRSTGVDRIYKEELRQKAQDMIESIENGQPQPPGATEQMQLALNNVKLEGLAINVRRADKIGPFINFMYKNSELDHEPMINELIGDVAEGNKQTVFRNFLLQKSAEIVKEIEQDATGLYMTRNISEALNPNDPQYYAKSLAVSKLASIQYKIRAKPLTDEVAGSLYKQFEYATIKAKQDFITQVLKQVPEKADQDAIFTQIDRKGAGNLNVYADMIDRQETELIKGISEGREYRNDKGMKLMPKGIDGKINTELQDVYELPVQLREYREVIKDAYAKAAYDEGDYDPNYVNPSRLEKVIKSVVGNIVNYDGKKFLLPNNKMDFGDLANWMDDLDYRYLDQLGGVLNYSSRETLQALRDGDFKPRHSLTRGTYRIEDAKGDILMKANTKNGRLEPFLFRYDRTAPKRNQMNWTDFKASQ